MQTGRKAEAEQSVREQLVQELIGNCTSHLSPQCLEAKLGKSFREMLYFK